MIKKKLFGGLALGIASVVSGGVALACGLWASAQDEIVLPETAYLGTTIEIPEKTFTYGGQEWKASVMVTAPDGGEFTGNVFSAIAGTLVALALSYKRKSLIAVASFAALSVFAAELAMSLLSFA